MLCGPLQELGHVCDDSSEHELVLLAVKPAKLGDAREEGDQTLDYKLRQLRLRPEICKDIVPDINPLTKVQSLCGSADQLGDGGGSQ